MATPLRVGVIGVNAERGWARESHVPAVESVDGLTLAAVGTSSQASAEKAAAAFGVGKAYGDPTAMFADPDIDVVTVAAPVPAHHELVLGAARAGKHVYSEWPLGVGTAQTEEIARVAAQTGVHTVIGLQARMNPAVVAAARLVESGAIGRVLHAPVYTSTAAFGGAVPDEALYLEKPETGMNLGTIQLAHTIDLAGRLLGPLESLSALLSVQYPELTVGDRPRAARRVLADHVLVQGRLARGAPLSVEVVGGHRPGDTPFRLDVAGDRATVSLVGGAVRGVQAGVLSLLLDGVLQTVEDVETRGLPEPVVNIAAAYAALRDDISSGNRTVMDFDHARRLTHLVDDIRRSDTTARRVDRGDWPL